jgi:hypothetical protein
MVLTAIDDQILIAGINPQHFSSAGCSKNLALREWIGPGQQYLLTHRQTMNNTI